MPPAVLERACKLYSARKCIVALRNTSIDTNSVSGGDAARGGKYESTGRGGYDQRRSAYGIEGKHTILANPGISVCS